MNDHFSLVPPRYKVGLCYCRSDSCKNNPYRWKASSDPTGDCPSTHTLAQVEILNKNDWVLWQSELAGHNGALVFRQTLPEPATMMLNTQVKVITNPHCTRDNPYFACRANAYRTKETDGCVALPKECAGYTTK